MNDKYPLFFRNVTNLSSPNLNVSYKYRKLNDGTVQQIE